MTLNELVKVVYSNTMIQLDLVYEHRTIAEHDAAWWTGDTAKKFYNDILAMEILEIGVGPLPNSLYIELAEMERF